MPKNDLIITAHSHKEAIAASVIKNQNLRKDFQIVTIEKILNEYDIFDELTDKGPIIRWSQNEEPVISNLSHAILNRVTYVPDRLFEKFTVEDREYAKREFDAYIGFSFNSFLGVANNCPKGLCGKIMSLPEQWHKIAQLSDVVVPKYYWGPSKFNSLKDIKSTIYSNIYQYYNWSVKNSPINHEDSETSHLFCFVRPVGTPVFVLTIGSKTLFTSQLSLPNTTKKRLIEISKMAHFLLDGFISETLFFIGPETISFGCINHEIIASKENSNFDTFVSFHLMNEFEKCLN
jgi:hypothetical protein